MDSEKQEARISVSMKDVGNKRLPFILDSIQDRAEKLFNGDSIAALHAGAAAKLEHQSDSSWGKREYNILLTGTSVTFLEGNRFIIHGLKDSIF